MSLFFIFKHFYDSLLLILFYNFIPTFKAFPINATIVEYFTQVLFLADIAVVIGGIF